DLDCPPEAGFDGADLAGAGVAGAAVVVGAVAVEAVAGAVAGFCSASTGGPVGMSAARPRPSPPLRVALIRSPDSRVPRVPPTRARRRGSSSRRAIQDRSREPSSRNRELRKL